MAWKALRRYKYGGIRMNCLDPDGLEALRCYKYSGIRINWLHLDGLEGLQTL
jgi:hypothetical protein